MIDSHIFKTYELFQADKEPFSLDQPTQMPVNEHCCLKMSLNAESVCFSHFLTFI